MRRKWTAVLVCFLFPVATRAQTPPASGGATAGYLGIENLRCNCTFSSIPGGGWRFIFRSEPIVLGVAPGSPAAGVLQVGDTIAEIDGVSLLTREGAGRFASIQPNQQVSLRVRRRGGIRSLRMTASRIAAGDRRALGNFTPEVDPGPWDDWDEGQPMPALPTLPAFPDLPAFPALPAMPAPVDAPVAAAAPRSPRPGQAPPAPASPRPRGGPGAVNLPTPPTVPLSPATPLGWFGFSIRCSNCGWASSGPGATPVWESRTTPELAMVEPNSPAGRAGLRAGDRITHVDGRSILTREGALRFGAVRPGQTVRLTVERDGAQLTREITLERRPEARAAIAARQPAAPTPPPPRRQLRYTGKLDDVAVEVWSPGGPTVERVGDTLVITIGGSVVRLRIEK